jgi:hypothetical protein
LLTKSVPATGAATTEPDNKAAVDAVIVAPGIESPEGSVVLIEGTADPLLINTALASALVGDTAVPFAA